MSADARAEAWRKFRDERLRDLDPDGPGWPSRFEMFVAGFNAGDSRPFTEEDVEAAAIEFTCETPDEWEEFTESYKALILKDMRAALDAVTARRSGKTTQDKEIPHE